MAPTHQRKLLAIKSARSIYRWLYVILQRLIKDGGARGGLTEIAVTNF
jgi:hypothetical protein